MAAISKQLDELLLWLRSERIKRENLQVDALPYSSQLSDSSSFNRPDPKPIYEIKADKEIPKASSKSKRRYKLQKRISCEELDERTMKGLCVFCEEPETPGHYLQHPNSCLLMVDSEDYLSDSMVNKIGNEISSDRWLSNSIGCELESGETDNDEDRASSDSDLVVNDIKKVKKDLVAIDVDSETDLLTENNQQFQEQAKNRFTNSVLQSSLVPQLCSILKEQVHEAREENSRFENHKNWVQHVLLEEDSTIHLHEPVSKSENLRQTTSVNSREAVVGVVEKIRQVTSVTNKFSTRQRQLFGKKFKDKERLKWKKRSKSLKSWRFKFKSRDMNGYNLSRLELRLKNSLVITGSWRWFMMNNSEPILIVSELERKKKLCYKTWMFKYKVDEEGQGILQSRTGWVQEVFAVICFLLRRHLHLNLDCEEAELAGRKRNQGLFIRLHNNLKKQRCPKSWMFKFKTDSKSARTNHILHQEKKPSKSPKSWKFKFKSENLRKMEVLFQHSHGLSNRLHRQDLQDLQQFITFGEVTLQLEHKWKFKGKGREVRKELCHTSWETIQEGSSHCFLLVAAAYLTIPMQFGSEGNHVWHRWKARYSQNFDRVWDPGVSSFFITLRSRFLEGEGFDIGNEMKRVAREKEISCWTRGRS